jgi:hypothetical protein
VQLELPSRNRLPGESPEPGQRKEPKISKGTPKKGADSSHGTEKRRLKHDDGGSSSAKKRRHSSEERQRPPQQQRGGNSSTEKKRNSTEERQRQQQQGGSNSSAEKRPAQQQRKFAPFRELLKGVVFTISGFQNPLRGNIRDKALGRLTHFFVYIFMLSGKFCSQRWPFFKL